jgi:hypothetical protein
MTEVSYSLLLRNLSDDHFRRRISFEEYRAQRKQILDSIDVEFNGLKLPSEPMQPIEPKNDEDEPTDFMQTIAFDANKYLDD